MNKMNTTRDVACIECCECLVRKVCMQQKQHVILKCKSSRVPKCHPADGHHYISPSRNDVLHLTQWIDSHMGNLIFSMCNPSINSLMNLSNLTMLPNRISSLSYKTIFLVVYGIQRWPTMAPSTCSKN